MLSPGFETVYTGRQLKGPGQSVEPVSTLIVDESRKEIRKWSVWPWTWPGKESDWGREWIGEVNLHGSIETIVAAVVGVSQQARTAS